MQQSARCTDGNNAKQICFAFDCKCPNPFLCDHENVQCKQVHKECLKINWINLKKKIYAPTQHKDLNYLQKLVTSIIHKAIKNLNILLQNFKLWITKFGLFPKAVTLLELIEKGREDQFTGKDVDQIMQYMRQQKKIYDFNENQTRQKIQEIDKKMRENLQLIRKLYEQVDQANKSKIKINSKLYESTKQLNNTMINIIPKPYTKQQISIIQIYLNDLYNGLAKIDSKPTHLVLKVQVFVIQCNLMDKNQFVNSEFIQKQKTFVTIEQFQYITTESKNLLKLVVNQLQLIRLNLLKVTHVLYQMQHQIHDIDGNLSYYLRVFSKNHLDFKQIAELFKNPKFQQIRVITYHYPHILGRNDDIIKTQRLLSDSLMNLPYLESLNIFAKGINSKEGFERLGTKLKAQIAVSDDL